MNFFSASKTVTQNRIIFLFWLVHELPPVVVITWIVISWIVTVAVIRRIISVTMIEALSTFQSFLFGTAIFNDWISFGILFRQLLQFFEFCWRRDTSRWARWTLLSILALNRSETTRFLRWWSGKCESDGQSGDEEEYDSSLGIFWLNLKLYRG